MLIPADTIQAVKDIGDRVVVVACSVCAMTLAVQNSYVDERDPLGYVYCSGCAEGMNEDEI